jgi:hypothetical protein
MKKKPTHIVLHFMNVQITVDGAFEHVLAFIQYFLELIGVVPPKAATLTFFVNGKETTMENLTATQQEQVTLKVTTKSGKPATLDGIPEWSSSDDSVATVTPAADGMSAVIKAVNDVGGVCQITASGDADLGAGVIPITGFLDVTVAMGSGGQAAVFELIPGAPTEQ